MVWFKLNTGLEATWMQGLRMTERRSWQKGVVREGIACLVVMEMQGCQNWDAVLTGQCKQS